MFLRLFTLLTLPLLLAGCILTPTEAHDSATGIITGRVLDGNRQPVAGAEVTAIYARSWTWVAVPNQLVVCKVRTDASGRFRIITRKRVDVLSASFSTPIRGGYVPGATVSISGEVNGVTAHGNVIYVVPLPSLPPAQRLPGT